jgi:lysophospholipase L1-like esterase
MNTAKTLVCFGDSITEGVIGASYVDIVRGALPGVRVINAGINGDTVIHLLRRVERDVVAHQPDIVMIMVGLNDLTTAYGLRSSKAYYHALKNLHTQVAPRRFIHAYRQLIRQLRARTHAQIALCTLTTVGENPADPVQHLVDAYSIIVKEIAEQEGLPLIDVRAAFMRQLEAEPRLGPEYRIWVPVQDALAIKWRGASYAGLSERRGYRLLCDGAHLAPAGAALVAETVLPQVRAMLGEAGRAEVRSQESGVRLQQM